MKLLCQQLSSVLCFFLISSVLISADAQSQTALDGSWSGSFTLGNDNVRQIIFNLRSVDDGTYIATLDMPTQGSTGIQVDSVTIKGDEITLVIRAARAEFYGTLRWTDTARTAIARIDGDWNQVGEYVAVSLFRQD
jgi:hypothetical protein